MLLTTSWLLDFLIFIITLTFFTYKYFTRNNDYWKRRGVFYHKPIPFFGNFYDVATFKTNIHDLYKKLYDSTDEPYFGVFVFDEPVLVIKSPQLLKNVLIRDFNKFADRSVAAPKHNPIISNFIFMQRYNLWKTTRAKLTPLFTTSMIRSMFPILEEISDMMINFLGKKPRVMDAKEIGSHVSIEFVARCFYGQGAHCFDQETSLFRKCVHDAFAFTLRNAIVQSLYTLKPSWVYFFKLDFLKKETTDTLVGIFKESMAMSQNVTGKARNLVDVMNLAGDNSDDPTITSKDQEIIFGSAVFFLLAGQDTVSTLTSRTLYELAMHETIQEKLRNEIKNMVTKHKGLTLEGILETKYLYMCMKETLRKYTGLPFLDRVATADYHVEGTDFVIEKGTIIHIPTYAFHRDEKHFPNPGKYDPERFLEANQNADGLTYIPFGEGPKMCIGRRLGMIMAGLALSNILLKYKIERCDSTPVPLVFEPRSLALASDGIPLKIVPIS